MTRPSAWPLHTTPRPGSATRQSACSVLRERDSLKGAAASSPQRCRDGGERKASARSHALTPASPAAHRHRRARAQGALSRQQASARSAARACDSLGGRGRSSSGGGRSARTAARAGGRCAREAGAAANSGREPEWCGPGGGGQTSAVATERKAAAGKAGREWLGWRRCGCCGCG